ncbi:RIIa domain-containing protein 1 isoform X2 [Gasterosteus aculeatus]|uniref:RIIa domain-containing protein n=1 Tax=Gasterosteus aculeatus aculeatus TaxID=481459 RepID=A0AAQ4P6U4_GASAC
MAGSGGSGNPEVGGLSAEQQEKLQHFKVQLRNDNERYLKSHPELDVMVGDFLGNVLLKRPTDIHEFAADYFSNPNLPVVIASKMKGNME